MAVPIGLKLAEWIKASEIRVATTSHTLAKVKSYRMAGLSGIAFEAIEQLRVRELQVSRTFRLWFGAATILRMFLPLLSVYLHHPLRKRK
jgi:ATP-binding cassette, subfamily C (CFTR/MRP), member 1